MPTNGANGLSAGQLSPANFRRILEDARKTFDTVIVDTGPILGSLEASIVAAEVDRVVMTLSRGEQRMLAEKALDRLESIDARLAGIVFNRARQEDLISSGYSSSSKNSTTPSDKVLADGGRLGPIGLAVASYSGRAESVN